MRKLKGMSPVKAHVGVRYSICIYLRTAQLKYYPDVEHNIFSKKTPMIIPLHFAPLLVLVLTSYGSKKLFDTASWWENRAVFDSSSQERIICHLEELSHSTLHEGKHRVYIVSCIIVLVQIGQKYRLNYFWLFFSMSL